MGLRLKRNGPVVSRVATWWCGTTVVRCRSAVAAPDRLTTPPATVSTTPARLVGAADGRRSGSSRCSASVAASGPAKSSGGNGTRTWAPPPAVPLLTARLPAASGRQLVEEAGLGQGREPVRHPPVF